MGLAAATGQERWMRALAGLAMVVALAVLLAACAGSNQPFSKSHGSFLSPSGKTPPPISIAAMNGLPGDRAEVLFQSLAASAGKRDIAIVKGHIAGNLVMAGDFQAMPGSARVIVAYRWVLSDGQGQVLHTIQAQETGRPVAGDPWQGADPDLLRRIAAFTAENLSSRLSQLGYATQAAGLPPPANALARAGPDAENDIDLETLNGPDAAFITAAIDPAKDPAPEVGPEVGPEVRPVVAEAPPPPTERADKPAAAEIRAVAVTRVNGSPGTGNGELVAAMRKTLKSAGWPVLKAARADALTIRGEVDLSAPGDKTQTVTLKWIVAMPDGKVLGTIDQANRVPAGSLDQGWGQTAEFAAQAAAQGIFDVVKKAQAL